MGEKSEFEKQIERRIAAHVRQQMVERRLGVNAMARRLGVQNSYVSRLLNDGRGCDAAFVARLHTVLGISANVLLDEDPPREFWRLGPPAVSAGPPRSTPEASSTTVPTTKHRSSGGGR